MATGAASGMEQEDRMEQPRQSDGGKDTSDKKKIKKKKCLVINLTHCRYDSVRRVARRCGLQPVVGEGDEWTVYWVDTSVMMERVMDMKRYQKINHFPGMGEICRKDLLGRNLTRMKKLFPKEYNIFPRTWVVPADYSDFQAFCRLKKHKTFISKPESGCQGRGIFIFKNPKDIKPGEHSVVQQYISKPFTIDGFKFDCRVYVLVTSCDPLRVYVYKDGLGRFATVPYRDPTSHNMGEACLHLTNYSINKNSGDFVRDDLCGSKRRLSTVDQWFVDNGYDIDKIWAGIEDVIIKTIVSAHSVLRHNYRSCFPNHTHGSACFEILGFDVLLDHRLKAWIIEVNHSPSFHTDSALDREVKEGLLHDTLQLIDLRAIDKKRCLEEDKRRAQQRLLSRQKPKDGSSKEEEERAKYAAHLQEHEKKHLGGFRRIYPREAREDEEDPYTKFFEHASSLCADTAASKARIELAKMQRQEIEQKAKEEERLRKKLSGVSSSVEKVGQCRGEGEGDDVQEGRRNKSKIPHTAAKRAPFRVTVAKSAAEPAVPRCEEDPTLVVEPQAIDEREELQRLAGLELRDRLIRGLDIPHRLTSLLASPQSPPPPPHSSLLPPHSSLERHTSTHHSSHPTPLPHSLSAGRHRLALPSHPHPPCSHPLSLRCGQTMPPSLTAPMETFGLLVTPAPVAKRLPVTHTLSLPPHHISYRHLQPTSKWDHAHRPRPPFT